MKRAFLGRSDLLLALAGGFVLGTGLVVSGALEGDTDLPVATSAPATEAAE